MTELNEIGEGRVESVTLNPERATYTRHEMISSVLSSRDRGGHYAVFDWFEANREAVSEPQYCFFFFLTSLSVINQPCPVLMWHGLRG